MAYACPNIYKFNPINPGPKAKLFFLWTIYRVVKCDVIKNIFLEFLNFFSIFQKSIKNNVHNYVENQLNVLSIG